MSNLFACWWTWRGQPAAADPNRSPMNCWSARTGAKIARHESGIERTTTGLHARKGTGIRAEMVLVPCLRGPLPGERPNAEPRGRGGTPTPGGASARAHLVSTLFGYLVARGRAPP